MSAKIMGQVWDLDLPHPKLLVLLALADHADHEGGSVFPSLGLIAWKTGYCVRQIRRIMRALEEEDQILKKVEEASAHRPAIYQIDISKAPKKSPYRADKKSTLDTPDKMSGRTSRCPPRADIQMSADPSINHQDPPPPAHARVASNDPETPVSNPPSEKNGAGSFAPTPQSPQSPLKKIEDLVERSLPTSPPPRDHVPTEPMEWVGFFMRRCGYRREVALTGKTMAMFRYWVEQKVSIGVVEDAAEVAEGKRDGVPSNPLYYRGFVQDLLENKNPATTESPPLGTNERYKKKSEYDSIQQSNQYAHPPDYKPAPRPKTDPRVRRGELTKMSAITGHSLSSRGTAHDPRQ